MTEARVDLDVVGPAHRIDGAVATGDRAERGLLRAQPRLEAPVDALAVRAGRVGQDQPAADVRDLGVGERANQLGERVRRPRRIGVGERQDLAVRLANRPVLRGDLAGARAANQPYAGLAGHDRLDQLVGAIVRRVRGDDDLEPVGRVVEGEQVFEPPLDHRLLVVGGDDHRHARRGRLPANGSAPDAGGEGRRQWIRGVRPDERAERGPEDDLDDDHDARSSSESTASYRPIAIARSASSSA